MSVLERLALVKAAGLTFAINFWPWLLAAFLLGAGTAGWAGFTVAKLIYQGDTLRAELHLTEFQKALAQSQAEGERIAAERLAQAIYSINARDSAVNQAMASIPGQVAALLAPKFSALRESINAPQFDCLRIPFPAPGLRLLERPGGRVGAAQGGGDPEGRSGP